MVRFHDATLQRFLEDEVQAGKFASVDAAIEAAVRQMRWDAETDEEFVDAQTQAAIDEADASVARGEVRPWPEVRAELIRDLGLKI